MRLSWRAFAAALLITGTAGGGTYIALHAVTASVHRSQDEKDVITYNDGFIDGENNIIDQCTKVADPMMASTYYRCPLPVVDR